MEQIHFSVSGHQTKYTAHPGQSWMQALEENGFYLDAPCGGHGSCGKCGIQVNGETVLACRTAVQDNAVLVLPQTKKASILSAASKVPLPTDGSCRFALAIDLGTTTIAACLLDGASGTLLAQASCLNPQTQYGADLISRIEYAAQHGAQALCDCAWQAFRRLTGEVSAAAGIRPAQIDMLCVVGNTAMHHLLLGIDVQPLITPPYMPKICEAIERRGVPELPIAPETALRVLPNIAGFVGADTVGCMSAVRFDELEELTLLIDIGTNGEMVLGTGVRRVACSTAAGPAFEGAKIACGMRGAAGAIDHVHVQDGALFWHVIGGVAPTGICGSGLLDLIAALLELGEIDASGKLAAGQRFTLPGTSVYLTQQDVREVQLAKAAIRAGIALLCAHLGVTAGEIRQVLLAGAFGNYLSPASACRIGMLPPELLPKICGIGNAAGLGAQLCALSADAFVRSRTLAAKTEFLELASRPDFQDQFVDALRFEEEIE